MPPRHHPASTVHRLVALLALALSGVGLLTSSALAQVPAGDDQAGIVVDILPVDGFVDPSVAGAVAEVIRSAEARGSELVVIQLDAPGSVSADVEGLLATIESAAVPVAVFVGPLGVAARAGGGAGLLWLAADVRALATDATVGPLEPVDVGGDPGRVDDVTGTAVPEAAADARLADRALGPDELAAAGLLDLEVAGLEPLLVELDGTTVTTSGGETTLRIRANEFGVRFHSLGLVRRMLHAATTAPFVYLLFVVGLALLLFELFQPGFGVAGLAGGVTGAIGVFGLTVLPATGWAVALLVLGLLLYALDTAIAGLGPVTLAATASFGAGSWWLYEPAVLALPAWLVVATTLAAAGFFVLVMTIVLRAQAGPEGIDVGDLVGKVGVVRSVLDPEGHVYVDGALWRARWTGAARRAKVGTTVTVHDVEGPLLLVEPFEPRPGPSAPAEGGSPAQAR